MRRLRLPRAPRRHPAGLRSVPGVLLRLAGGRRKRRTSVLVALPGTRSAGASAPRTPAPTRKELGVLFPVAGRLARGRSHPVRQRVPDGNLEPGRQIVIRTTRRRQAQDASQTGLEEPHPNSDRFHGTTTGMGPVTVTPSSSLALPARPITPSTGRGGWVSPIAGCGGHSAVISGCRMQGARTVAVGPSLGRQRTAQGGQGRSFPPRIGCSEALSSSGAGQPTPRNRTTTTHFGIERRLAAELANLGVRSQVWVATGADRDVVVDIDEVSRA